MPRYLFPILKLNLLNVYFKCIASLTLFSNLVGKFRNLNNNYTYITYLL